jgi:hypothetical protein
MKGETIDGCRPPGVGGGELRSELCCHLLQLAFGGLDRHARSDSANRLPPPVASP